MIRRRVDSAMLLARTTRHLRPSQVLHRARLRAQRFPHSRPMGSALIELLPTRARAGAGWPVAFTPLDSLVAEGCPAPEDNAQGRFTFLNDTRDLGRPLDWDATGSSRLWRYHLHYMDWTWSFASHPDRAWARSNFDELWRSWERSAPFGRGDEWSPYVASLRAWTLCGTYSALVAGSDVQSVLDSSLVLHARFLRWHVEHDVGGNHLIKNLKALIGLGIFLGDEALSSMATRQLQRQIPIQILADGGHYERSPSYHCQVLGDLVDVAELLAVAGRPAVPGLAEAIERMRRWLGLMLLPDGDVPLFNDCVLVGPARASLLRPGPAAQDRLTVLGESGYVILRPDESVHLVADVGDPCPPDLPAHAQADCLSFELAVNGARYVVDSGTSTYEHGPRRAYERSTPAHNTVSIDGADQTEVWATFRAARLARGCLERTADDNGSLTVTASHDGYRRLPGSPVHRRTWSVSADSVRIIDEIMGHGQHQIESHLHFAPEGAKVMWTGPSDLSVTERPASYATGFGDLHEGHLVSAAWTGDLPIAIRMELPLEGVRLQGSEPDRTSGNDDVKPMKGNT